jgi:Zn-dependent protease
MAEFLQQFLIVVGVVAAVVVLRFIVVLHHLLRLPLWPLRVEAAEPGAALADDQEAAMQALRALGFREIGRALLRQGPLAQGMVLLRHDRLPAFAQLAFQGGAYAGYPVTFYSFVDGGDTLVTLNRAMWSLRATLPGLAMGDALADSLEGHWQVHQCRIAGLPLAEPTDAEAMARVTAILEGYFPHWRSSGRVREGQGVWHLTLGAALDLAGNLRRLHRLPPYTCAEVGGLHQPAFFAFSYHQAEAILAARPSRRTFKAGLLAVTIVASLAAWAWAFGTTLALALLGILLVHEAGHAVAMRAFGYRDMTMLVVPMVGAVVTGQAKSELAAWQQAVILLAGPLPGLGIGAALLLGAGGTPSHDVYEAASLAIIINLFNLLPLTPLDGGQLLEVALFSRWPAARPLTAGLSVIGFGGLSLWSDELTFKVIAGLMVLATVHLARALPFDRAWQPGLPESDQIRRLFEVAQRTIRVQSFTRHYAAVKGVVARRRLRPARWWEGALALVLLIGVWIGAGVVADRTGLYRALWGNTTAHAGRTRLQVGFDALLDDDYHVEADRLRRLETLARGLAADDPRQVDLEVVRIWQLPATERSDRILVLVKRGRDGYTFGLRNVVAYSLDGIIAALDKVPPAERAEAARRAADAITDQAPDFYVDTIPARLKVAEAIDQGGDHEAAWALLGELRHHVFHDQRGAYELNGVVAAQVWFQLNRGEPEKALAALDGLPDRLGVERAWALLAAGRQQDALAAMRRSANVNIGTNSEVWPEQAMDLAYILGRSGHRDEARALIAAQQDSWVCSLHTSGRGSWDSPPWQQVRYRLLAETAGELCPGDARR